MRKTSNPFGHKPTRLGHQDRYYAQTHRKRTYEKVFSTPSRSSGSTTRKQTHSAPSTYNHSGESNPGCMIAVAVIILIVVIALTIWSSSWEWASYSYPLNHKTDWSWLKVIFYPLMIFGAIFCIFCIKTSLPKNK